MIIQKRKILSKSIQKFLSEQGFNASPSAAGGGGLEVHLGLHFERAAGGYHFKRIGEALEEHGHRGFVWVRIAVQAADGHIDEFIIAIVALWRKRSEQGWRVVIALAIEFVAN